MRHPWSLVLLSLSALFLSAGCGGTKDGPANPGDPGPGTPPSVPDFGPPAAGQNDPLRVTAVAIENDKKAPFTVGLMAEITGGTPPYDVTWDFDGDSETDGFGESTATTFASAGDFPLTVNVKDASNTIATDVLEIHVLPPGPDLRITGNGQSGIVSGRAPLAVSFNTSQTLGTIVRWEWDFDGNGTIDYTSTVTGNVNIPQGAIRPFDTPGTYTPILRATNEEGFTEEASILVIATF
ncbi:MAG: hypothetical protein GEEBNDBF_00550 [bacterium]|nr:hypothetical protein [bacterium]